VSPLGDVSFPLDLVDLDLVEVDRRLFQPLVWFIACYFGDLPIPSVGMTHVWWRRQE
jgi:hypothetical protein